jgi:integrase
VAALHSKIGKHAPYEANRTLALISKMFELARRWGFVPKDQSNPARDIARYKEEKRDRWVNPEELPRLAEAIDAEPNVYARFGQDHVRQALEEHAARIMGVAGKLPAAEVVNLKTRQS